jgi:chromosome segregation ATPase
LREEAQRQVQAAQQRLEDVRRLFNMNDSLRRMRSQDDGSDSQARQRERDRGMREVQQAERDLGAVMTARTKLEQEIRKCESDKSAAERNLETTREKETAKRQKAFGSFCKPLEVRLEGNVVAVLTFTKSAT